MIWTILKFGVSAPQKISPISPASTEGRLLLCCKCCRWMILNIMANLTHYRILLLRQFGLFSQMRSSYFGSIDKCRAKQGVRPKNSKLNLYDLASAFYVLGLGCCFSFFAFLVEIMKIVFQCSGTAKHAASKQNDFMTIL